MGRTSHVEPGLQPPTATNLAGPGPSQAHLDVLVSDFRGIQRCNWRSFIHWFIPRRLDYSTSKLPDQTSLRFKDEIQKDPTPSFSIPIFQLRQTPTNPPHVCKRRERYQCQVTPDPEPGARTVSSGHSQTVICARKECRFSGVGEEFEVNSRTCVEVDPVSRSLTCMTTEHSPFLQRTPHSSSSCRGRHGPRRPRGQAARRPWLRMPRRRQKIV